jgi:hypothetical protein
LTAFSATFSASLVAFSATFASAFKTFSISFVDELETTDIWGVGGNRFFSDVPECVRGAIHSVNFILGPKCLVTDFTASFFSDFVYLILFIWFVAYTTRPLNRWTSAVT